jgi:hypothetical protein
LLSPGIKLALLQLCRPVTLYHKDHHEKLLVHQAHRLLLQVIATMQNGFRFKTHSAVDVLPMMVN